MNIMMKPKLEDLLVLLNDSLIRGHITDFKEMETWECSYGGPRPHKGSVPGSLFLVHEIDDIVKVRRFCTDCATHKSSFCRVQSVSENELTVLRVLVT